MSLADLQAKCVDNFASSSTRADIMAGLEAVVQKLLGDGVTGELWVDGSFLTEKIDPEDVDIVLRLEPSFVNSATSEQHATIDWVNNGLRADHYCDSYLFVEFPQGDPREHEGQWGRAYWIRQYGFNRDDESKGIAVISL